MDRTKYAKLEKLFCSTVRQMADDLAECAEALRSTPFPPEASQKAYSIAHSLHGAGTMYGFPQVTEMGASLEKMLKALAAGRLAPTPAVIELVDSCANALRGLAEADCDEETSTAAISRLAWKCECTIHESDTRIGGSAEVSPPPA